MREIKFRAWCTAKNVMLQRSTVSRAFVDTNHALSDKAREENYILMQYTGLKDKNGVEIYEGDVLEFEWRVQGEEKTKGLYRGEVEFSRGSFSFMWAHGLFKTHISQIDFYGSVHWVQQYAAASDIYYELRNIQVIGNIYENPELLSETNK